MSGVRLHFVVGSMVRRVAGLGRYLLARCLVYAADVLPRGALMRAIGLLVEIELRATRRGRSAVAEGEQVLGLAPGHARRAAASWLVTPMVDLVDLRRMCRGRERPAQQWTIEHVGWELARQSLDVGQPVLAATGHFSYAATMAAVLSVPALAQGATVAPLEPFRLDGEVLWRRLVVGMTHQLARNDPRIRLDHVGHEDVTANLRRTLRTPGGIGLVFIDVPWDRAGAVVRPFCAEQGRALSSGPARLARLAGVPIILAVPERTGPRSCRVHWGPRIEPPARGNRAADVTVLNELVDALERHIGRHRGDYPYPIGWERRWDPVAEAWQDPAVPGAGLAPDDVGERTARFTGASTGR